MGNIKKMSKLLSSKIAAGEVVERPASVVKELMENSIDALATEITVHIEEGGKRLISVTDNGSGIAEDDALLTMERFATSKLTDEDDLTRISTMGFRGEALSSIASVSRLEIKSSTGKDDPGVVVKCEGGLQTSVSPGAAPPGTSVSVSDLFFNTPARAKFLRTVNTEFSRVADIFKRLALAHPEIKFKLTHGKKLIISSPKGKLIDRIGDIFGIDVVKELIEILPQDSGNDKNRPVVSGFIANPSLTYATGKGVNIFLNHRAIRDPGLTRALITGYSSLIDRGRWPVGIVNISMPSEEVDVNVHPAKSEVRFSNPGAIFDLVRAHVSKALGTGGVRGKDFSPAEATETSNYTANSAGAGAYRAREGSGGWPSQKGAPSGESAASGELFGTRSGNAKEEAKSPEFLDMEPIGQLWGEYLVCEKWPSGESGAEFFIIDQHGAAERVRYERLKAEFYNSNVESQLLLLPESIETTPEEADSLNSALPTLARVGFAVEPFGKSTKAGGETFMVKAAPKLLGGRSVGALITTLTEELADSGISRSIDERIEAVLMTTACHSVIRGQKRLPTEEARTLLKELAKVDFAARCPHGRSVVKRYTRAEIDKLFDRS